MGQARAGRDGRARLRFVVPGGCGGSESAPAQPGFVTRFGAKLMLNGKVFRFSGANIYWGGLDDDSRDALNYPTHFRVNAALQTVAAPEVVAVFEDALRGRAKA